MDAHLFRLFWENAHKILMGARIGKIQEPQPGLFTFDIYNHGSKRQLCWSYGKQRSFCFLSDTRLAASHVPGSLVMRIRKYFMDRHIACIVPQYYQRRLWLMPNLRDEEKNLGIPWLCLDLTHAPTLHFKPCQEEPEEYCPKWPSPEELAKALIDWREWPVLTPALRKKLRTLPREEQWALMEDLRNGGGCLFLQKDKNNKIISASAWPLFESDETIQEDTPGDGGLVTGFARAGQSLILDRAYADSQDKLSASITRQKSRLQKLLAKLDQDEKRLLSMQENESNALLIAANLWQLDAASHAKTISLCHEGNEKTIPLDERFSIQLNMEKFFHTAKRGKRGLALLEQRRADTLQKLNSLNGSQSEMCDQKSTGAGQKNRNSTPEILAALRQTLPGNILSLLSSDGYVILCGRDAKGNLAIRKHASPHDLWVHVENGSGAHVIIRRPHPSHIIPDTTLDEAGKLAAQKSWLKNSSSASIMYAEVRHVHTDRKGPTGKVLIDRLAMTRTIQL